MVYLIYKELKTKGRVQIGDIGLTVQSITPTMASGLHLPRSSGLVVCDVERGSPAEAAGIRVQDILLSLDGSPINTVAQYAITFYTKGLGDRVELQMLRDSKRFAASALVQDRIDDAGDLFDQFDVGGVVRALGIMGTTLNEKNRVEAQAMRSRSGVLVWGGN